MCLGTYKLQTLALARLNPVLAPPLSVTELTARRTVFCETERSHRTSLGAASFSYIKSTFKPYPTDPGANRFCGVTSNWCSKKGAFNLRKLCS